MTPLDGITVVSLMLSLHRLIETETPAGTVMSFLPPGNNNNYEPKVGPAPAVGEHSRAILAE